MAEARSAIGVFEEHKQGIKLLTSEEGVEVHFVIPYPHKIRQNVLRKVFQVRRFLVNAQYPASPASTIAIMVVITAIVLSSGPDSIWRNGTLAWTIWELALRMFPMHSILPHTVYVGVLAAWSAFIGFLGLMYLNRVVLRCLLSYRRWMYLQPKEENYAVIIWGAAIKLICGRHPLTFSFQGALPFLPLPKLQDTCDRYLASIHPLVDPPDYERIAKLATNFLHFEGPKLQRYLIFKSWWSNNYVTDWWEQYVYLKGRTSLMINSNYYVLDMTKHLFTKSQPARAAVLVHQMMKFKQLLDREQLTPLRIRGIVPLCMRQYRRMFSTTRIPERECDELKHYGLAESKHIVVLCRGYYFIVPVVHRAKLLSPYELQTHFKSILETVTTLPHLSETERSLAALTAEGRIVWAEAREKYFSEGVNKQSLKKLESAVFFVCLDDSSPSVLNDRARALIHGDGTNRWFDKSLSLIVFANGHCGLNAEHSWADAPVVAHLWEYMLCGEVLEDPYDNQGHVQPPKEVSRPLPPVKKLQFDCNLHGLNQIVQEAVNNAKDSIADLDLHVVNHNAFGKGLMKQRRLSPDAFIQLGLQYAYYKDSHGSFTQTYEASMTRLYREGRTETVRPVTDASKAFVLAMENLHQNTKASKTLELKRDCIEKLQKAAEVHQELYRDAMSGKGVDRHLFTLYCVSVGMGIESTFLQDALARPWRLSTSQQPQQQTELTAKSHQVMQEREIKLDDAYSPGGGFGPVVDDGYGVSYMITGENQLYFHISSKKSALNTNSKRFGNFLFQAFDEMKTLWLE